MCHNVSQHLFCSVPHVPTSCLFLLAPDPVDIPDSGLSQRFTRAIEMYEEDRDGLYLIVF